LRDVSLGCRIGLANLPQIIGIVLGGWAESQVSVEFLMRIKGKFVSLVEEVITLGDLREFELGYCFKIFIPIMLLRIE